MDHPPSDKRLVASAWICFGLVAQSKPGTDGRSLQSGDSWRGYAFLGVDSGNYAMSESDWIGLGPKSKCLRNLGTESPTRLGKCCKKSFLSDVTFVY